MFGLFVTCADVVIAFHIDIKVRHLEKEKHLEDHFASNPTPTSTTAPTKDGDSNETSTEDVFSNESTESDNVTRQHLIASEAQFSRLLSTS